MAQHSRSWSSPLSSHVCAYNADLLEWDLQHQSRRHAASQASQDHHCPSEPTCDAGSWDDACAHALTTHSTLLLGPPAPAWLGPRLCLQSLGVADLPPDAAALAALQKLHTFVLLLQLLPGSASSSDRGQSLSVAMLPSLPWLGGDVLFMGPLSAWQFDICCCWWCIIPSPDASQLLLAVDLWLLMHV